MKIFQVSLLVLSVSILTHAQDAPPQEKKIIISQFVDLIHKRLYFIARLEKTMGILQGIEKNKKKLSCLIDSHDSTLFHHQHIKEHIAKIQNQKTLAPLLSAWNDFTAYKEISDCPLAEELIKLIFIVTKNIIINSRSCSPKVQETFRNYYHCASECTLNLLDDLTDYCTPNKPCPPLEQMIINRNDLSDIHYDINTEPIITRYYHTQRLTKSIAQLSSIKFTTIFNKISFTTASDHVQLDSIKFYNKRIIKCINELNQQQTYYPLQLCWHEFSHYRSIKNEKYLKEFLILIFILYKQFFVHASAPTPTNISIQEVIQIYQQINQLPIEELMQAIDTFTDELANIMKKNNLSSQAERLKHNAKKYWWVAPALLAISSLIKK